MKTKTDHQGFVQDVIAAIHATGMVLYGMRIAVVRDPAETQTKGGILLPDQAQRKEPTGMVVAIGLGVDDEDAGGVPAGMRVGDHVMYTKYNPIEFRIELPDGRDAKLEVMHVSDLYIGWR